MSYGVLYGQTGLNKIPLSRTKLTVDSIVAGSGIVAGATPSTFTVGQLGLHQIDFDINVNSPTNDTPFTIELWDVTANALIQARTGTAPQQSWGSDMYFGFEWTNASIAHEYAFYITPNVNISYSGFALLLQNLNFRAVVQEFGGAGVGPGTVGKIAKFTAVNVIGDSIMTEAGTTITVAGAVAVAGANNATFVNYTDGQNVAVSAANEGRMRYNTALQTFEVTENGGAWHDLTGVATGTVNRLSKFTAANNVGDSSVTDTGIAVSVAQTVATSGSPALLTLTGAAHTTLAAGTECIDVNVNLARTVQFATGAIATQRAFVVQAPSYAFAAGSVVTTAATFAVTGAPATGLNATFTNTYAAWIQSGALALGTSTAAAGAMVWLNATNTNTLTISSGVTAATHTWTLPVAQGAASTFLQNNGAGVLSWAYAATGSGTVNVISKITNTTGPVYGDSTLTDVGTGITQLQTVATSGTPHAWTLTAAAHTTLAAGVEATDVNFNLARTVQWATGGITTQRAFRIQNPTYAFAAGSTITTAATLAIDGAPQLGLNAAITNPYALWVESGQTQLDGLLGIHQVIESVNAKGACTGNQTFNLTLGNVVTATLTGAGIWTITNPAPSGKSSTVTFILTNAGAFVITWAVVPKWPGGIPPVFTAAGTDVVILTTTDGGTTWYASVSLNLR